MGFIRASYIWSDIKRKCGRGFAPRMTAPLSVGQEADSLVGLPVSTLIFSTTAFSGHTRFELVISTPFG